MAPEVASQEEHDTRADVWSATCTLLHMMNARHPWIKEYNHLPSLDIVIAKHSPPLFEIPKGCHDDARRLIERGLTVNPQKRPQAAALRDEVHDVLLNLGYPSPSCFENNIKKLQSSPPESFGPPPSESTTEPSFTLNTPPPLPHPPEGEEKKEPKHVSNVYKTSMWDAKPLECGVTRMRKESEKENSEIIKAFHRDRLSTCNSEDLEEWLEMVETAETWLDDDVMVPTDTS
uniref:Protein kinase domain-containing protein n=1 Tax=Lepisosteus oculatus TaxID=7918 RepID=W5MM91_LEPOC